MIIVAKLIFSGDRVVIHKTNLFRLYDGFAINNKDMQQITSSGVKQILIIYRTKRGTEQAYLVSVENWLMKSITHDNKGELQSVLRRKFFDRVIK